MGGPLAGLRVVEIASLGPGPFCAMMLADMGADVVRIDRPGKGAAAFLPLKPEADVLNRGRRSVALDLKCAAGAAAALDLIAEADALVEGFRPGVMERLGLGPEPCLARNPALVYGRMTGWGQTGPRSHTAGHDIDYIALSGALAAVGEAGGAPVPPLNMVGDFGGGAMLLGFGLLAALLAARSTGQGQVVDAAMVEGSALLMAPVFGYASQGFWRPERGANLLDGGAPFYAVYETACGGHMAVGALEPPFFATLVETLGVADHEAVQQQYNPARWPAMRALFDQTFRSRDRAAWTALFEGSDACVAPVLSYTEAPDDPHNRARDSFVTVDGVVQPAPAPRFSATPAAAPKPAPKPGADTLSALSDWGFSAERIEALAASGAFGADPVAPAS
ncbi:carnitine dehydratase [Rhodothalassium salexigens]|uniref:CaiB/BaiF CoA transferase family protein n=1 Tax=Rhodothalassium salexigens TaxID=1086 RepID=UPI0019131F18|nr:CaiB/BaiF CoA-transferase family protein [Rhodothalassium salexigens]MBK5911865.1 carnitine dehydratase [Rhodothalassium salexigens]MBK5922038.1 carnitine dehydratase [Rhodothalassium salexigens]